VVVQGLAPLLKIVEFGWCSSLQNASDPLHPLEYSCDPELLATTVVVHLILTFVPKHVMSKGGDGEMP
jgi:hypothetical protein